MATSDGLRDRLELMRKRYNRCTSREAKPEFLRKMHEEINHLSRKIEESYDVSCSVTPECLTLKNVEGKPDAKTAEEKASEVCGMLDLSLSEFARRGLRQKVHSQIIDEDIWIVSTEEQVEKVKPDIAYTVEECAHLSRHRPGAQILRNINMIKKIFDGELEEVTKKNGRKITNYKAT